MENVNIDIVARSMGLQDCFAIRPVSERAVEFMADRDRDMVDEVLYVESVSDYDDMVKIVDEIEGRFDNATWRAVDRRELEEIADEGYAIVVEAGIIEPGSDCV